MTKPSGQILSFTNNYTSTKFKHACYLSCIGLVFGVAVFVLEKVTAVDFAKIMAFFGCALIFSYLCLRFGAVSVRLKQDTVEVEFPLRGKKTVIPFSEIQRVSYSKGLTTLNIYLKDGKRIFAGASLETYKEDAVIFNGGEKVKELIESRISN